MNKDLMFKSEKMNCRTPQYLFNELNEEFNFTLDPCSDEFNYKCKKHYTEKEDGLSKDWSGEVCFVNPPYGREIGKWVEKSYLESLKGKTKIVMLIPSRTDTKYFHDFILNKSEIRFIRGRIKFLGDDDKEINAAPFPSMVVIYG